MKRTFDSRTLRDTIFPDKLDEELEEMGVEVVELLERLDRERQELDEDNAQIALIAQAIEGKEPSDVITELSNLIEEAGRVVVELGKKLRRWWKREPAPDDSATPPKANREEIVRPGDASKETPRRTLNMEQAGIKRKLSIMGKLIEGDPVFQKQLAEASQLPEAEMVQKKITLMKTKLIEAGLLPISPAPRKNGGDKSTAATRPEVIVVEDAAGNPLGTPSQFKLN